MQSHQRRRANDSHFTDSKLWKGTVWEGPGWTHRHAPHWNWEPCRVVMGDAEPEPAELQGVQGSLESPKQPPAAAAAVSSSPMHESALHLGVHLGCSLQICSLVRSGLLCRKDCTTPANAANAPGPALRGARRVQGPERAQRDSRGLGAAREPRYSRCTRRSPGNVEAQLVMSAQGTPAAIAVFPEPAAFPLRRFRVGPYQVRGARGGDRASVARPRPEAASGPRPFPPLPPSAWTAPRRASCCHGNAQAPPGGFDSRVPGLPSPVPVPSRGPGG